MVDRAALPVLASRRLLLRPLTLREMALLRDGRLDRVEPRIDPDALTGDTLAPRYGWGGR